MFFFQDILRKGSREPWPLQGREGVVQGAPLCAKFTMPFSMSFPPSDHNIVDIRNQFVS